MNKLHRKAKRKIEKEFKNYKKFNLKYASKAEIWDICHRIYIYTVCMEYFSLNPDIPKVYLELALADPALLQTIWSTYKKYEQLKCDTWNDVEDILAQVLLHWKLQAA